MQPPTKATLSRYGLTVDEWQAMYDRQAGRCPVCNRDVDKLVIDHEHIRGWKSLPPEQRKLYVRGLLCVRDNWRFLPTGLTGEIAGRIHTYLSQYEGRRDTA